MSKLDWEAIRREYETDGVSARKLAVKHGISHTAINQKSKAEGWQKPARKPTGQKSSTVKVSTKKMETKKVETPKLETGKSQRLSDERVSDAEADNQSEDVDDLGFEPSEFGLSDQQALFVFWYVKTKNRVEAYKKAGYKCTGDTAYAAASRMYRNVKVSRAIKALAKRMRQRYTADLDEIVDQLVAITRADPNLVSQYRRVNCRFCWGQENKYQWRDENEYEAALSKATDNGKTPPEDGGTGFIDNADPNPDCPRCQGEGKGQMIINDTRDLDGDELMYYLGVKQTKNGLEVLTESKQAARAALIRILEIKEANKPAVPVVPEEDYQLQPLNTDEPTPDNPNANPNEERVQLFYINARTAESRVQVDFELCSPFDIQNLQLPARQILPVCTWCLRGWYRTGTGCDYNGTKYFQKDGTPTNNPALDVCGGRMQDCRNRFGDDKPLPFGGFPAANLQGK